MDIKNGDVYDIGQSINGISTFIWLNSRWHYFTPESAGRDYEYSHNEITRLIEDDELNGNDEVKYIGNAFKCVKYVSDLNTTLNKQK